MEATPFGHYQLQELIGRGGMGEVYRAYDTRTDRVVALKVLPVHLAQDETYQQRFRRESQAVAGLNDPHVVPIHGFGEIDGRLYLDMRLIEGRNLGTVLNDKEPLDPRFAVSVVEQVAQALDSAHEAGLVHRDIKPSNILITDRDFVYLIDFGLARTAGSAGLTTAGSTLGTLAYMAPERFENGDVDRHADIYALTCVLYECLTGKRPYPGDTYEQQIAGHMVAPAPRPSDTDPRLAAFDEVIARGMAKKPGKRYPTATELAAAARRALARPVPSATGSGRHHRRPARERKRPVPVLAAAGVVALAGVIALGAWIFRGGGDDPAPVAADVPEGVVAEIAQTVPADIRDGGRLIVGVNVPYKPNEFKNAAGEIVGFDVDLMNAVARTLGLAPEYRELPFEAILPSVRAGDVHVGMASLTVTPERSAGADFVTYFQAGTLWAQPAGGAVNPADACGLRVGVSYATIQESDEVPFKSEICTAAGKPPIDKVVYVSQDDLTEALMNGEIDAMSADSPVTGFAVKTSGGALQEAGEIFSPAPYGWPVTRGSPLAESLRQALEHLIATGEYRTIATMWGVEKGMIDRPEINAAAG